MFKPKITLISCNYYRPDLLRRAIQSVQKQTFQDYEYLIVSAHCPFTEHVYNDFKDDDRIKFLEVKEPHILNGGASAFNVGIENAKSNHISYLLDDDVLHENHLEEHHNYKKKTDKVAIHSMWDCLTITGDNCVKDILSKSYDQLCQLSGNREHKIDVCGLSHDKNIDVKWVPRAVTEKDYSEAEDNYFINQLQPLEFIPVTTVLKIAFGGFKRIDTNGNDLPYHQLLMNKLQKDEKTLSGWRMVDDTPYVYPQLKDTLYETKQWWEKI